MANFINNSENRDLKSRLLELIGKSEELKFLVGFFYFSGIRELYDGLVKNPEVVVKVLVGLDIDKTNYGIYELAYEQSSTAAEVTYRFFDSIKKSLNTESFDTEEFYKQVKFFVDLIQKNKLIIRKTEQPNHSKLYLFKLEKSQVGKRELFITGSSNLTKAGLVSQNEFNVEIGDYGFTEAESYFDDLWKNAISITEHEETKKKLIEVVEKQTLVKDVSPFEAYCLLLKLYLESFEQKEISDIVVKLLLDNGYKDYRYQLDAVKQALAIIEQNNGVIIADVVGLGKTVIACAIAKHLKKRGVIICPPGIMGDKNKESGWSKYVEEFKLEDWDIRSVGDLESTLDYVSKRGDIEVIIVDEAHRLRNQDTRDYELMKGICRDKIVILLSATPFNNRPADILSLLKLFIVPKKSAITLESNLVEQFSVFKGIYDRLGYIKKYHKSKDSTKRAKAEGLYRALFEEENIDLTKVTKRAKYLATQIRNVIEPVTIRRNRLDLKQNPHYKDEVKELSKCADPMEWFFDLSKKQSAFYSRIIEEYFGDPEEGGRFQGAIYRPFEYEIKVTDKLKEEENRQLMQQRNLLDFMRRLLVKRFESSFGSFAQSIRNFKRITETVDKFVNKTDCYILDRDLLERICELDLETIEEHLLVYEEKINKGEYPKNHRRYNLKGFAKKKLFLDHIKSDIALFEDILKELDELDLVNNDPKTKELIKRVGEVLKEKPKPDEPKRKVVIFSEYVDTVKYLEPELRKIYSKRLLVVPGELNTSTLRAINRNFDASFKEQDNDYDILLTTDKISEGFNLNRAGIVVNHDIPWNPVRVIQRVGRINRVSKKVFEELYIANFFPTETGAELVKSREIAQQKMFMIHSVLGEDAKIFEENEEPTPSALYQRIQKNPDDYEEESFYTKALKEYEELKSKHKDILEGLTECPPRVKVAKKHQDNELLVFFKKGRMYATASPCGQGQKPDPAQVTFEEAFDKVRCGPDEPRLKLSEHFWESYEAIKRHKGYKVVPRENTLEQKALNMLEFLDKAEWPELMPYKTFLRALREDIIDYGTLADYTLRRIANLSDDEKKIKENIKEIMSLVKELGKDYLAREKNRLKEPEKEIIIAVENQKV